jgi:hypothetical protein
MAKSSTSFRCRPSTERERRSGGGDAQRDFAWRRPPASRELHANFAGLAHYPHNEHMPRSADRMGILVWEEIPVYWGIAFGDPAPWPWGASSSRS